MSSFIFDGLTAIVPFPVAFPLVCLACDRSIKESAFKRDVFRHSKACRQRNPGSAEVNELVFECTFCKYLTPNRRQATTHQATHFGDPQYNLVKYSCSNCTRNFATQKALSSHLRQCGPTKALANNTSTANVGTRVMEADHHYHHHHHHHSPPHPIFEEAAQLEPQDCEQENPQTSGIPDSVVDPSANLSFDSVSSLALEDLPTTFDTYPSPVSVSPNFMCDNWINELVVPKQREQNRHNNVKPRLPSRMTPQDLQQLYSANMRKAFNRIQHIPDIECEVDACDLRHGLLLQLESRRPEPIEEKLWKPCTEGLSELSTPFQEHEVVKALHHPDSAPGPDGWSYSELAKIPQFSEKFLEGIHMMAATGVTPESWKSYKSMMLFKKPDNFKQGEDKILKNFRPITLSNTTYKLLTAILCRRLSAWLEKNKGISYSQRAVFSRQGVQENTLVVQEAINQKKTILFLDLSDAFNSIEHIHILNALKQCGCPSWIIQLIKSIYSGCTTTPVNLAGNPLSGPVPVTRGVRQGCPLSGLLFNLVLDPIIRGVTTENTWCLGYMDDLAIITEEGEVDSALVKVVALADKLGLSFNPSKCGVINKAEQLKINDEIIPKVSNERTYRYLGTEANLEALEGLEAGFQKAWRLAEKVEFSELTPMQKIHAIRSKIIPMIYHLVENSSCMQHDLQRINRNIRRKVKRICFLPERATNSYIHLHRKYGGPGIPDLVLMKSRMTISSFLRAINMQDEFGSILKELLLKGSPMELLISSINRKRGAGLSKLAKETCGALSRLEKFLDCKLQLAIHEDRVILQINDMNYKNPSPTLESMIQKRFLHNLKNASNQGRFWSTLSANPKAPKQIFNFHTKMCDWRFAHTSRLNLTPVRANFSWHQNQSQNCRRCQLSRETLNHVLNNCPAHRKETIHRHNEVRDAITNMVPKTFRISCEQRFGNLQPDIILEDDSAKRAYILDVKVSAENFATFEWNDKQVKDKYEPLRRAHEINGYQTTVHSIQFGSLGGVTRATSQCLLDVCSSKRVANLLTRKLSNTVLHWSRNISVHHMTGFPQNF